MKTEISSETVKMYGSDAGAIVIGIAAAEDLCSAPDGFRPADVLPECRSVIVLGVPHPKEALSDIDEYTENRNAMLTAMTEMSKEVAKRIKADGYKTKAISATGGRWAEVGGRKEHFGHISLKHAAEAAGLGVIGRNCLLTSPQYGNLLWLSAVLTDAELTPDGKIGSDMCSGCSKCVEACPSGALDDPVSFGKKGCSGFFAMEGGKLRIKCFLCRTVCPHCRGL